MERHGFGPLFGFCAGAQAVHFLVGAFLAELILQGFELLAQEVFPLLRINPGVGFGADVLLDFEQLGLAQEGFEELTGLFFGVGQLQQALLGGQVELHVAGQEVRKEGRRLDAVEHGPGFHRDFGRKLQHLSGRFAQGLQQAKLAGNFGVQRHLGEIAHPRHERRKA